MNNLILGGRPPLLREAAGMIFGIVFVLTGGYSGLEFILALIGAPLLYAGIIRLVVIFYRFFILLLGNPLICGVLAFVAFGVVLTAVTSIIQFSMVLGIIVVAALAIAEAWFFIRDIRAVFASKA